MKKSLLILVFLAAFSLMSVSAFAGVLPVSSCAADFSSCSIYDTDAHPFALPFLVISGDVVLTDGPAGPISDVFRFDNDVFDSGGGTGLGDQVFALDGASLPNTLSVNAIFLVEGANGCSNGFCETDFIGNGTLYQLFSQTPEPSTFIMLGLGLGTLKGLVRRKRSAV